MLFLELSYLSSREILQTRAPKLMRFVDNNVLDVEKVSLLLVCENLCFTLIFLQIHPRDGLNRVKINLFFSNFYFFSILAGEQ